MTVSPGGEHGKGEKPNFKQMKNVQAGKNSEQIY